MKLPHHRTDDGHVVWRGVVAAAGRLDQTNFPSEDMGAVKKHLASHFKEFEYGFKDEAVSLVEDPTSLVDSDQEIVIRGVVEGLSKQLSDLRSLIEKRLDIDVEEIVRKQHVSEQESEMPLMCCQKKTEGATRTSYSF